MTPQEIVRAFAEAWRRVERDDFEDPAFSARRDAERLSAAFEEVLATAQEAVAINEVGLLAMALAALKRAAGEGK